MNTQEKIEIMQAHLDGAVIQSDAKGDTWSDVGNPVWNWYSIDYRVKPEPEIPKEVWIQFNCLGGIHVHSSKPTSGILGSPYSEPVHFREVIEDDQ